MICKHILLITFLNEPELIFCTQLSGFKYSYINQNLTSVIYLHTGIVNFSTHLSGFNFYYLTHNYIQYWSFVCTRWSGSNYLTVVIHLNTIHSFNIANMF